LANPTLWNESCLLHVNESILHKMKNLTLFISFCLFAFTMSAQQPVTSNTSGAKIKFESEVVDYGIIPQDGDGNREFKFTNVGKEPLILTNVNSSCGCLVASWPKEPIAPGKSGMIKAHYDTKRVGKFQKTLTVQSNDGERPSLVLKIKGEVLAPK